MLGDLLIRNVPDQSGRPRWIVGAGLLADAAAGRSVLLLCPPCEIEAMLGLLLTRVREEVAKDGTSVVFDTSLQQQAPIEPARSTEARRLVARNRVVAYRYARALWDLAIANAVPSVLGTASGWHSRQEGTWRHFSPPDWQPPDQGWKLHLSASIRDLPEALSLCASVLSSERAGFKHAATVAHAEELVSGKCGREVGGKLITVYPPDADSARRLAEALDGACGPRGGQVIVGDRAFRPGSPVHYRYGVIARVATLGPDGVAESMLVDPEGRTHRDQRGPGKHRPSWIAPLFDVPTCSVPRQPPSSVILNGRYLVSRAIRHANRGGVYRACDQLAGREVVIKQARRGTASELTGDDATNTLRHEAANLARLAGIAPEVLDLFEVDDSLFLVQSRVPGVCLREWLLERCRSSRNGTPDLSPELLSSIIDQCIALVDRLHSEGLVCRDFNPNNLMIDDGHRLRLIDLELADEPGSFVIRYYTPGYGAPELIMADKGTICPEFSADIYSLGATIYSLVSGSNPPSILPGSQPSGLAVRWKIALERLAELGWPVMAEAVAALVDTEPDQRPTLLQARRALMDAIARGRSRGVKGSRGSRGRESASILPGRLVRTGAAHIVRGMAKGPSGRLWPSSAFGGSTDPCNVQHGAGGVLGLLCSLSPEARPPQWASAVGEASGWILQSLRVRDQLLPGLYFGASGALWACLDAARCAGRPDRERTAIEMLLRLPTAWPNPDVCHGLAGAGLALCHAWQTTGDARLLEGIDAIVDRLVGSAVDAGPGLCWETEHGSGSMLAGLRQLGFAHGSAGIACFLLAAHRAIARPDALEAANAAGRLLLASADVGPFGARWASTVDAPISPGADMLYYWCNGSAGIGTALVRLWLTTGLVEYRKMAEAAARAAHWIRWHAGPSACHGLAGNGELLLDMAQWVDPGFRRLALDLARCLAVKTTTIGSGHLLLDEDETGALVDFNTGSAGALSFLDRLDRPRPRLWMADHGLKAPGR